MESESAAVADDTALMANSQERLRQLGKTFWRVWERRKLRAKVSRSKVMKCIRMVDDRIMNVALNGKLIEKVNILNI